MPLPDDESSDDDEEDIFARPDDAVEAVWSDDDDENETRGLTTSDDCERRDDARGTPTGTRVVAFARDDDREDDGGDVARDGRAVGDAGKASTSGGGADDDDDDETTAKRRRVADAPAPNRDAEPLEEEDREEENGCESMAMVRSRMLLADFDTLARPPEPTYRPAATTVDDESESEDDVREYGDDNHRDDDDDDVDAIGVGADVGNRINVVFQAPNGERFTRSVGERETFARVVEAWRDGYEWAEVVLALGSDKVRIVFEGDAVRGDETPEALGLEDDDMLELLPG